MNIRHAARFVGKRGWEHWPEGLVFGLGQRAAENAQQRLNVHGRHEIVDRSAGRKNLLVVLAGYKEHLWPFTLHRIARFVDDDVDVCLVSPAKRSATLDELAATHGWTRLITKANSVALAQNLAIAAHPQAEFVFKLDEDVLIADGFFTGLRAALEAVEVQGDYTPGFCAPVLNVNGFSYVTFLETMGLREEYRARFGQPRRANVGVKAQSDGEAAAWLWRHSLPFDDTARRFSGLPQTYSVVPHLFSIGAIVFRRELWEAVGGYRVTLPYGILGFDELHLCLDCVERSRVMVVAHNVFAGHFSFGPQDAHMREQLPELAPGLAVTPPA